MFFVLFFFVRYPYLHVLLNGLFRLLLHGVAPAQSTAADDAVNTAVVGYLLHLVNDAHAVERDASTGHNTALLSYVRHVFAAAAPGPNGRTVHGELARHLTALLNSSIVDHWHKGQTKLHMWFFLEIIAKSLCQHVAASGELELLVRLPSVGLFYCKIRKKLISYSFSKYFCACDFFFFYIYFFFI